MKTRNNFYLTLPMVLLAATICLSAFMLPPAKSIELKYNLKKDQKFDISMKTTQNTVVGASGQTMSITQNIEVAQNVTVADATDKDYSMDVTIKHITVKQNMMGMDITWDSEKSDETDPMSQQFAAQMMPLIDKPVSTVVDLKGNVISKKNADDQLQSGISSIESIIIPFPEGKIEEGAIWESVINPTGDSDYQIAMTYTLNKIGSKTAQISCSGAVSATSLSGKSAVVKGTITGVYEINLATGWFVSSNIQQQLTTEMEEEGMTIKMTANSVVEMTSK